MWLPGALSQSCTDACAEQALSCDASLMEAHNDEVDSVVKMTTLLNRLPEGLTCASYSEDFGSNGNVPCFAKIGNGTDAWCAPSSAERQSGTYDCNAPTGDDSQRLCLCSPPPSPPSPPPRPLWAREGKNV